ncbi:MAG: hypothetical protein HOV96_07385 [Nonomuraea sp.]|nr:hypothetical protein [Nonomuraea sp.]
MKLRAVVPAAVIAVLVTGGLTATPAQAAEPFAMSAHLTVTRTGPDHERFEVEGKVTMSQAAAYDAISHGYKVAVRYWGDDPSSDDLLHGPKNAQIWVAYDGLHFKHTWLAHVKDADEDDYPYGELDDTDEFYAGTRFLDPKGATFRKAESNRVTDYLKT